MYITYSNSIYISKSDSINGLSKKDKWNIANVSSIKDAHDLIMALYDNRSFYKCI